MARAERHGLDSDYWLGIFQDRAGQLGFDQDDEWLAELRKVDAELIEAIPPGSIPVVGPEARGFA